MSDALAGAVILAGLGWTTAAMALVELARTHRQDNDE